MFNGQCSVGTVFEGPSRQGIQLINILAGFRAGFQYGRMQCTSAASNMQSARQHPEVIDAYLAAEVRAGRVLGPMEPGNHPRVHVNKFGLAINLASGG